VTICLAVAITPRFFMTGVADNVLSEARAASEQVDLLQYQLKQLQEELLPLIDTETEDDNASASSEETPMAPEELDVTSLRC